MELTNFNRFKELVSEANLKTALFDFAFINLIFKCLYIHSTQSFILSIEQKSVGFSISIRANQTFNGKTPKDFYYAIRENLLKENDNDKIAPLFDCLNNKILAITKEQLIAANDGQVVKQISLTRNGDKNFDEDCQRPFFENWYRHKTTKKAPSEGNLYKTERYFGTEIMEACKKNKITTQWSAEPSNKSLLFLTPDLLKQEVS